MPVSAFLGNSRIKSAFGGRAPGAPVLLEGPAGSGRKTAAFHIAAGLLCGGSESRGQGRPCWICPACKRLLAGTHPDVHILEYDGKAVKIERVREFRALTFVKPQEAETKVFIICEADKLSELCQNALLKALEEPQNCVFLLTCEDSSALLQTVRSRCVTHRMEPLSAEILSRELAGEKGDIAAAIAASGGFLGRARVLLAGSEPEYRALARAFAQSLSKGELDIFSAAAGAEKLGREQFPLFLEAVSDELLEKSRAGDMRGMEAYEYICGLKDTLAHNPGAAALLGALAARCGALYFGRRG